MAGRVGRGAEGFTRDGYKKRVKDNEKHQGLRHERPFAGVSGPCGPEVTKRSQKQSSGGSARESSQNTRNLSKIPQKAQSNYFGGIFDIRVFSGTFSCGPPKTTLFATSWDFRPVDSCR